MAGKFHRLIRFKDESGEIHYGEVDSVENLPQQPATIYEGETPWGLHLTDKVVKISEVLCPLPSVPIIYGVGLNYKKHIAEASLDVPKFPVIFTKPNDALTGPYEDVPIESKCLQMDYEGELCVVIGKDVKNFSRGDDVMKYILGYTIGNDVSSRYWQNAERSGGQHGMGKSFDKFAPIGPVIVSSSDESILHAIEDGIPSLNLQTHVNGELRQETNTSDLLFRMTDILEYLSLGRTIRKGTVIMTGTPSGVGAFWKPPKWLQNGDVVQISIEKLGEIENKMFIGA